MFNFPVCGKVLKSFLLFLCTRLIWFQDRRLVLHISLMRRTTSISYICSVCCQSFGTVIKTHKPRTYSSKKRTNRRRQYTSSSYFFVISFALTTPPKLRNSTGILSQTFRYIVMSVQPQLLSSLFVRRAPSSRSPSRGPR